MNWKDIGNLVGKAAPILGTVVGGPAGTVVGSLIASALGVENTAESVYQELKNNPDAYIKIKQFELDEKVMLKDHIQKMAEINFKNVSSAREREVNMGRAGYRDYVKMFLAIVIVLSFILFTIVLFWKGLPSDENTVMLIGTGYGLIIALLKDVYNYSFGSTQSSSDKNDMLLQKDNR